MNQIESFRHVLGLPEPGEGKAAVKVNEGDAERTAEVLEEHEKPGAQPRKVSKVKKKEPKAGSYGRSVSIKPDTYAELKALLFWASRENLLEGSTMDALFKALIHPTARKSCGKGVRLQKFVETDKPIYACCSNGYGTTERKM